MDDVLQYEFCVTRRKGSTIVESLILMIILGMTFGAIFTTLGWAQKAHVFSRYDRESRELLFSWVQAFESFFHHPPAAGASLVPGTTADALTAAGEATAFLGGTFTTAGGRHVGHISFFSIEAAPALSDGTLDLDVTIRSGGRNKPWVNLTRRFNRYSNDTVSDAMVNQ